MAKVIFKFLNDDAQTEISQIIIIILFPGEFRGKETKKIKPMHPEGPGLTEHLVSKHEFCQGKAGSPFFPAVTAC